MAKKSFRAKVTIGDDGNVVVEPTRKTGTHRYQFMLHIEHGHLKRTLKDYIIVFRFPRAKGILAAARHLICDTARLAILMTNLFFNHNEQ